MLNIELADNGLDEVIRDTIKNLTAVLGRKTSKEEKDKNIREAIGELRALYKLVIVNYVDEDTDKEQTDK